MEQPVVLRAVLQRYAGPDSPHGSNREMFSWIHAQIATDGAVPAIPYFLLLCDEVLCPPFLPAPSGQQVR
jgi:hypothetical protein